MSAAGIGVLFLLMVGFAIAFWPLAGGARRGGYSPPPPTVPPRVYRDVERVEPLDAADPSVVERWIRSADERTLLEFCHLERQQVVPLPPLGWQRPVGPPNIEVRCL